MSRYKDRPESSHLDTYKIYLFIYLELGMWEFFLVEEIERLDNPLPYLLKSEFLIKSEIMGDCH